MLGFFILITAVFVVYSVATTKNYQKLRIDEVTQTISFESERVDKTIAEMERNAVDLALAGRQFYISGDHSRTLGESVLIENFNAFRSAVGGGIWFEPYAIDPLAQRLCYYACYDETTGEVRYDPDFETEEYDYLSQMWYTSISAGLGGDGEYSVVWTRPYIDDAGTNALMTTVGAGIYDQSGNFVGMSTVDWQMQSVVDRLSAIKPTKNSFVLLASTEDDYIISSTHQGGTELMGESLKDLPWYDDLRFNAGDSADMGRFKEGGVEYMSFSRLFDNGWLFSVQIPSSEIFSEVESRNTNFTVIIAGVFVALLIIAYYLISRLINRPLRKLTVGVAELGDGNLDKQIEIHSKDEIGTLAAIFNKMTVELKASIEQNVQERAEKERMGAELDVATKIQSGMLPSIFPAFPDNSEFDIYAKMLPAKEVGGDFYDFFLIDENTLAVIVADVSGKGIPAALFMVIAKTLLKNNAQYGKPPKEVFEVVNNLLCDNNEAGMFVTAFMGYLDIKSGRFTYVNAGHNPPLVRFGGRFDWLKTKPGFVLAGMEDMFYHQDEITLKPGDELLLYTDGVTEAANNQEMLFGEPRLLETINKYLDLPLKELSVSLKREIDRFAEGAEQADDITILALRYKGVEPQ